MENEKINPEGAYKTLVILWFALLMSQVMFLAILFVAKPEVFKFDFTKPILGENAPVIIGLAALALANFGLSFVMKKRSYQQAVAEQKIALVQTGLIIACALCEAISLIALVLAFAFSYQYFFVWFALGILGIILHFPRRDDVIAASYKNTKQ
jgi:F0F1-type ATP synthase membrane subunit c/vacuolar-type H+-ATPase subunit K